MFGNAWFLVMVAKTCAVFVPGYNPQTGEPAATVTTL